LIKIVDNNDKQEQEQGCWASDPSPRRQLSIPGLIETFIKKTIVSKIYNSKIFSVRHNNSINDDNSAAEQATHLRDVNWVSWACAGAGGAQ
jgi:hypothetical protein